MLHMYALPGPSTFDLQNVVATNWNKSWATISTMLGTEITPDHLITLAGNGQGSLHLSDGTFDELSASQTMALVHQFCANENLEGTLKLSFGDATGEEFEDWMQAFPGASIKVNYFLSTGPAKGLRPHYDDHHVFAMQLLGEKVWGLGRKIATATPEAPSFYPKQDPEIEAVVRTRPGTILYIPSGGWHGAETESRSVHATIGIYPPTYAEYLRQLISTRAITDVILRSELAPVATEDGRGLVFKTPNLATIQELSDRVARVSASERSDLSSRLRVTQEPEITGEIEQITQVIWHEAEVFGPVALYLRGSAARPNVSGFQPWDIDLALVTRQAIPENAIRSSREEISGQELDLKYVTVRDLISNERELPTRLLLRSEGILLRGRDIVCELPTVDPSPRMAAAIAARQMSACHSNDSILEHEDDGSMMVRRCAKAALRLATPFIMLEMGRLERDPMVCSWFIAAHYPELRSASDYLVACVRGENVSSSATREATQQLLDTLHEGLSVIGVPTSE
jgi:cupin superfamily protein